MFNTKSADTFSCECGFKFNFDEIFAGKRMKCPKCGKTYYEYGEKIRREKLRKEMLMYLLLPMAMCFVSYVINPAAWQMPFFIMILFVGMYLYRFFFKFKFHHVFKQEEKKPEKVKTPKTRWRDQKKREK